MSVGKCGHMHSPLKGYLSLCFVLFSFHLDNKLLSLIKKVEDSSPSIHFDIVEAKFISGIGRRKKNCYNHKHIHKRGGYLVNVEFC